jgi:hypothetical protein
MKNFSIHGATTAVLASKRPDPYPVRASVTNIHQPGLWGQANFGQQRALYRADHLFGLSGFTRHAQD